MKTSTWTHRDTLTTLGAGLFFIVGCAVIVALHPSVSGYCDLVSCY